MDTFSAGSCIRFGWETFKKRKWFFVGAVALYAFVVLVIVASLDELARVGTAVSAVASLANWAVQIIAGMGMISFTLKAHDDVEHVSLRDFWHPRPFWKYLGAIILKFLIAIAPLAIIGLVIGFSFLAGPQSPAILALGGTLFIAALLWLAYIGVRLLFVEYLVIDTGAAPMEAISRSFDRAADRWGGLLGLLVLTMLLSILGLLCLVVGLLVSTPVTSIALVHAYRTLSKPAPSGIIA